MGRRQKVLIIGDVHAKVPAYINLLKKYIRKSSFPITSIQVGDFGFEEDYKRRNRKFEQSNLLKHEDHKFFGGNHDQYDNLPDFHIGDFGKIPFIDNSFFVRGALSIDKDKRTMGRDWWPEEELGWKQCKECVNEYEEKKPDILVTHDGPFVATSEMFPTKERINSTTSKLLDQLFEIHQPELWVFAHWHEDARTEVENTSFFCLDELSVFEYDISKTVEENVNYNDLKNF